MKELIEKIACRFMCENENLSWEEAWAMAEEYVATGQHLEFNPLYSVEGKEVD